MSPPSTIWSASSATTASARPPSRARVARTASTQPAVATSMTLTSSATSRWNHSIRTCGSIGGMSRPWHNGQSGHASPEPVVRTTEPITMSRNISTVVARPSREAVRNAAVGVMRPLLG